MTPEPNGQHIPGKQLVGFFYTWWRGDPLPALDPHLDLDITPTDDVTTLAALSDLTEAEVADRIAHGHRPYLARVHGQDVAYGWSAWAEAGIGELGIHFQLPPGNRYLWDFVTLPEWRGKGIYPQMLQAILQIESTDAERFWIGHDLGNTASGRGILKAGFPVIGEVWVGNGEAVFVPHAPIERARIAAELLSLPIRESGAN